VSISDTWEKKGDKKNKGKRKNTFLEPFLE
jgi:hypothetical protein